MNVLDRLLEKQRQRADDLTRLERLILASSVPQNERLQLAADLHNLTARAEGNPVIDCVEDLSALVRYQIV
jgi:hypothetical protein